MGGAARPGRARGAHDGWVAATIVLAITFSVAAGVWFLFHP